MVWDQRPCVTNCICFSNDTANSIYKIIAIRIIKKNLTTLNSPHNDVMECAKCIYPAGIVVA
jgi:hypothetical protein